MNALTAVSPLDVSLNVLYCWLPAYSSLAIENLYSHACAAVRTVTRDTRYATIVPGNWLAHSYFRLTLPTHSRLLRAAASSFNIPDHKFWLQLYPRGYITDRKCLRLIFPSRKLLGEITLYLILEWEC